MINKFKNTQAYLKGFSEQLAEMLKDEILRSRRRRSMNPRGKSFNAPIDSSGDLRRSIDVETDHSQNNLKYTIEGLRYITQVDQGRKPNQKPPPVSKILKWINDKPVRLKDSKGRNLSGTQAQKQNLAKVIANSIGFYGSPSINFVDDAYQESVKKLTDLGQEMGKDVLDNVEDILLKAGYIKKGDNYQIEKQR